MFVLTAELRKQEETGQLVQPVLFVLLVLVSVLLYFAVSLMDPGFILSDDSDLQVINDPSVCMCVRLPKNQLIVYTKTSDFVLFCSAGVDAVLQSVSSGAAQLNCYLHHDIAKCNAHISEVAVI